MFPEFSWQICIIILVILIIIIIIYISYNHYYYPSNNNNDNNDSHHYKEIPEVDKYVFKENRNLKSPGERATCKVFEEYLGREVRVNKRDYPFLKNPETNKALELDFYDPVTKIAIEYNGQQHYTFPNGLHATRDKFIDQIYRDSIKKELCEKNGIKLIIIPYTVDIIKKKYLGLTDEEKAKQILKDKEDKIRAYLTPILDEILIGNL